MMSSQAGNSNANVTATPRGRGSESSSTVDDNSPTNSTLTDFGTNAAASSFRTVGGVEMTMGSYPDANPYQGLNGRALMIRADGSLLTCFDPADKELYELWARKG